MDNCTRQMFLIFTSPLVGLALVNGYINKKRSVRPIGVMHESSSLRAAIHEQCLRGAASCGGSVSRELISRRTEVVTGLMGVIVRS